MRATPVGVLGITAAGTRFVPLHHLGWMAAAGAGTLIGVLLGRRRQIRG